MIILSKVIIIITTVMYNFESIYLTTFKNSIIFLQKDTYFDNKCTLRHNILQSKVTKVANE